MSSLLKLGLHVMVIILVCLGLTGCSRGNVIPVVTPEQEPESVHADDADGHMLWGIWDIYLDSVKGTARVEPARGVETHFNVTPMITPPACADCVTTVVKGFDPVTRIMDIDVTLRNPSPISGHDVRGILFTNDLGHWLANPDEWTAYFDIPGGDWINPFKAYAKDQPDRLFAGSAVYTEKYQVHIPDKPMYAAIKYAVEANWPGHCKEPYEITGFSQTTINDTLGASGVVEVTVHDWQDDVDSVKLGAYEITGEDFIDFTYAGEGKWLLTLTNNQGVKAGDYTGKIIATSSNSGDMALYDSVVITVSGIEHKGWARVWGGLSGIFGENVATDYKGNIFVAGKFAETLDFDPGPGVDEPEVSGAKHIYISKFTPTGAYSWVLVYGGNTVLVTGLAIDNVGNIYTVGAFNNNIDFDPGPGVAMFTSVGDFDAYVCKFSSYGDFLWAATWGSGSFDSSEAISIDSQGKICVAGTFSGLADLDPSDAIEMHQSNGDADIFLSKFTSTGDFLWTKVWGGAFEEVCSDVGFDGSGNIYVGGDFFSDKVDFDPGPGEDEHGNEGYSDMFISKFMFNGDYQWTRTWGGAFADELKALSPDSSGNVYVTGAFNGTVDFDPGSGVDEHTSEGVRDVFLSKFDSNGLYGWSAVWGGDGNDTGTALAYSPDGIIYVSGTFAKTVDFDPGAGYDPHTSDTSFGAFLSRFDAFGSWQWTKSWGEIATCDSWDIAVDPDNNAFISGGFQGIVDFDPGPEKAEYTSNYNSMDAYLSKFPPGGVW